jgi:uncharacterized membrane protein YraQ (UPF0718 family)
MHTGPAARVPSGRSLRTGGAVALHSLMCTCCTAPVAIGLRSRGAPLTASLAYWVGTVLNPAVLVFLFLVAPWQLGVVRLVVGAMLITLPALSVPSMVMVGRALSWRATVAMAAAVVVAGLFAAVLLTGIR